MQQSLFEKKPAFELKPFAFQDEAVRVMVKAFKENINIILNSPPSSGKTVMAAKAIKEILQLEPNKKVFFFVHLEDLFDSTMKALLFSFKPSEIQGVFTQPRRTAKIYICMVKTFSSRIKSKGWAKYLNPEFTSYCVFDEVHRGEHDDVMKACDEAGIVTAGLSGTPKRPKNAKLPLSSVFDKIHFTVSEIELIQIKRTVPPHVICPEKTAEKLRDGLKMKGDDYDMAAAAQKMMSSRKLTKDYPELWLKHAKDTKTLVFCCDINHAMHTVRNFEANGIRAKFFTGDPARPNAPILESDSINDQIKFEREKKAYEEHLKKYNDFQQAKREGLVGDKAAILAGWGKSYHILVNVGVFTTGFDDDTIKTVMLLRVTTSENLYLQMVGRGKRYLDGKDYYILIDCGENIETFGLPTISRNYPLHQSTKTKGGGDAPMKICEKCGQSVPAWVRLCETPILEDFKFVGICGHSFVKPRPERETKYTVLQWSAILNMNGPQVAQKFEANKKTTISDVFEYWEARHIRERDIEKKPDPIREGWFFHQVFKLWGVEGLIEFAENTGRDVDEFLDYVRQKTSLAI